VLERVNGNQTITVDGTVIKNKEIFGTLTIKANNVRVENTRVRVQVQIGTGVVTSTGSGVVIKNSEILSDHNNTSVNGIMGYGFTLDGVNIHDVVDQVHIHGAGNVTIKNSWLHDNIHWEKDPNWNNTPTHDDNIQVVSGDNIRVENSVLEDSVNTAMMMGQDAGAITNVTISGNTIGGGACSINVAPKTKYPAMTSVAISNNTFIRNQTKHLGCAVIAPSSSRPTMTANIWQHDNSAVKITNG